MTEDVSKHDLYACICNAYKLDYLHGDDRVPVCGCGHPMSEHMGGVGWCTGTVRVDWGF